ncbi:hypothetical protein B0T22DRAFT_25043 [Podospora appendiculata]|uniref:BHLH domain-containing protein n=1 Tax=Podospora appendiculata TaxID=314037 RepID=A0AAE0XG70_9PEZI|nr:hypothetical protein B0T22DRAFT_25043 [Podospora appendiculata]
MSFFGRRSTVDAASEPEQIGHPHPFDFNMDDPELIANNLSLEVVDDWPQQHAIHSGSRTTPAPAPVQLSCRAPPPLFSYPTLVSSARVGGSMAPPLTNVDTSNCSPTSISPVLHVVPSPAYQAPAAVDYTHSSPYFHSGHLDWQQLLTISDPLDNSISPLDDATISGYASPVTQHSFSQSPTFGYYLDSPTSRGYGSLSETTTESGFGGSESAATSFDMATGWQQQQTQQQPQPQPQPDADGEDAAPKRKRTKSFPKQDVAAEAAAAAARSGGLPLAPEHPAPLLAPKPRPKPDHASGLGNGHGHGTSSKKGKLRSAARSGKSTVVPPQRAGESTEERKTRSSHNLVEKQYRNRLNAQFESLLNALPETLRSQPGTADGVDLDGGSGGGGVRGGGSVDAAAPAQSLDVGERRLSKAEVLDLSRRYIQSLERERDMLEQEREELIEGMERLRAVQARELADAKRM